MAGNEKNPYLETQVKTAGPERLLLMLFDGAVRFAVLGRTALEEEDLEAAHTNLIKAQRIVAELMGTLDPAVGEELYNNLIGLYQFSYQRLVRSNLDRDPDMVDEAVDILNHLRETWQMAVKKRAADGGDESSGSGPRPPRLSVAG